MSPRLAGRERLVAVTLDYETWQPVPPGKRISWNDDVLDPTRRLLDVCDESGARLTIMAEVAEYLWLREHDARVAAAMEDQWREALRRGHDVQLHLHVSWLPELGARFEAGSWSWPQDYLRAADYEGDLAALIGRCKRALEHALEPVDPGYRVTCFRAGAYQVQPFKRLHDALVANDILCDTSVFAGGLSSERGYDFRLAFSEHQPYLASPYDPQLLAPADEARIVEIPVFTHVRGQRWLLDGDEGPRSAQRFLESRHTRVPRPLRPAGATGRASRIGGLLWGRAGPGSARFHRLNRLIPRAVAHRLVQGPTAAALGRDYFVMIGHSKGDLRLPGIRASFLRLRDAGVRFVTLAEMASRARADLVAREAEAGAASCRAAIRVTYSSATGRGLSEELWRRAPWDRDRLLQLSGGDWASAALDRELDWCRKATHVLDGAGRAAPGPWPVAAAASALPWRDGAFDLLLVVGALERQSAVDRAICELHRVLRLGGVLVAAIPCDARGPAAALSRHEWKTAPHEIEMRLAAAGFVDVEIEELDGYREMGLPPYPPALDRVAFVRAWKRMAPASQLERAQEIMGWVYRRLSPERSQASNDVGDIVRGGYAWCGGYNAVLARLLQKEGITLKWVTMEAEGHPRGRGPQSTDTHEVLEAVLDGRPCVLDSMTNRCHPHALLDLLARPELAVPRPDQDARYVQRGYELYDTRFWYERVARFCLRSEPDRDPCEWQRVAPRDLAVSF